MKRILLIVIKNIFRLPYIYFLLCYYASHTNKYSDEHRYAPIKKIARWIVSAGRVDVEIHGQENLPKENGFMFFPNHQGLFDGFAIVEACPVPFSTVYKKELGKIPLLKQILASVKAIALDREDIRQGASVIQQVTKELQNGRNYMIFAEGTRSRNENELLDFKGGSFKSAMKAKCPIVPVALIDSYKVFDTNSIARTVVQVHFLEAFRYEDYKELNTGQVASLVKDSIETAIKEHSTKYIRKEDAALVS